MKNFDSINYPAPKQEYKVLVRCYTYNHSKYIEDALNGFAMQQTNFPFVCVVVDDASTDGEQDIIKAWMERECDMVKAEYIDISTSIVIIVPHKTNIFCSFAFYLLKRNLYRVKVEKKRHVDPWREKCKYEALCEGDDYWIDSLKLQKQVTFMEENDDYSLIHSGFKYKYESVINDENSLYKKMKERIKDGFIWHEYLIGTGFILTCTVLFRISLLEANEKTFLDHGTFMQFARKGKIKYLDTETAIYRIIKSSMMRTRQDEIIFLQLKSRFYQLYYYSYNREQTHKFYYKNMKVKLYIAYSIAFFIKNFKHIATEDKYIMLRTILYKNAISLLMIPIAIFYKFIKNE